MPVVKIATKEAKKFGLPKEPKTLLRLKRFSQLTGSKPRD
jgi:hypothetical protein